jgi:hypothetical protein
MAHDESIVELLKEVERRPSKPPKTSERKADEGEYARFLDRFSRSSEREADLPRHFRTA